MTDISNRREYQAGRLPMKVFEYTLQGKYLKSYDSIADYRREHYSEDIGIRPLFINTVDGIEYNITEESIAFKQRVYRDTIVYYVKIINSKFCNFNSTNDRKVEVLNLKGEILGEFVNANVAKHVLENIMSEHAIHNQLTKGITSFSKYRTELVCRYKQE